MHDFLSEGETISGNGEVRGTILLPPGEYNFRCIDCVTAQASTGATIKKLTHEVTYEGEKVLVFDLLTLREACRQVIAGFFICIGLAQKDIPFRLDFSRVVGCRGRFRLKRATYVDSNGERKEINKVAFYLPRNDGQSAPVAPVDEQDADDIPF